MFELSVEGTVRISRFSGQVTPADLADAIATIRDATPAATQMDALIDLSGAEIAFTTEAVRSLAEWSDRRAPEARPRRVAVAVSDAVAYGYARAFQMLGGAGMDLRIFQTLGAARRWLGLDPD